jgi:pimeloyl-ACP methyl ester carboxylesterase
MDSLGVDKTSVYGGSMGAGVALTLALERPERIEKLVLRAPPPFGRDLKRPQGMFAALAILYRLFGARRTGRIVAALPSTRRQQRERPGVDIEGLIAGQRAEGIVPAIRGVLMEGPRLATHRFDRIRHPALVLTHPDDELHPLASGELLYERMPHAKLAVAPTHSYWSENPEALAHTVASFILGEPVARGLPSHKHVAAPL